MVNEVLKLPCPIEGASPGWSLRVDGDRDILCNPPRTPRSGFAAGCALTGAGL